MEARCHYTILGVAVEAGNEQLKAAYAQALQRFQQKMKAGSPLPVESFDAVCEAYRVLSDPVRRAAYDRARHAAPDEAAATEGFRPSAPVVRTVASVANAGENESVAVEFHGRGGEYFRIWLVNTALTFLTLGIYSAWAKVRRERYFHRNLMVDGAAFDYHGRPKSILFGRLIVVVLLAVTSFADHIGGAAKLAGLAVFGLAFPWLMVQSMRFRARNTSYRGVRLGFSGTYRQALVLYLLHGGLTVLSFGLYVPAFIQKQKAFYASHLHFGDRQCEFSGTVGDFYRALTLPMIFGMLSQFVFVVAIFVIAAPAVLGDGLGRLTTAFVLLQLVLLAMVAVYAVVVPWMRVLGINLFWNHLRFGGTHFVSTQKVASYLGLLLGNWLLTIVTLGFFWPFGQIRIARFRAANLFVVDPRNLREAVAAAGENPAALGSEALEAMDLDVSF